MRSLGSLSALLCASLACSSHAAAQEASSAVLELEFTPAPRAQIAVWIEDVEGRFLATVGLTEAVAYRGVGNRPGASQMNSGYRWPYGRREGILPVWGRRRAAAHGARQFKRVIFQDRNSEGLASRTSSDQSTDNYFCLSFDASTTTRDALDAVSCASVFTSDKGRFVSAADVEKSYSEPWTLIDEPTTGMMQPLSLHSLYPPRMDVAPCALSTCYDHEDLAGFADHARDVMPEIDAITMATPPGGVAQSLLFSIPAGWPGGDYRMLLEINTEGDYNEVFDAASYPTPELPEGTWDTWAINYGYAYRGQPSVVYEVPFELGPEGEVVAHADTPVGRTSWRHWDAGYGQLHTMDGMTDDPSTSPGSGADRFMQQPDGHRVALTVRTLAAYAPPAEGEDPWAEIPLPDPEVDPEPVAEPRDGPLPQDGPQDAVSEESGEDEDDGPGPVEADGTAEPNRTGPASETQVEDDPEGDAVILVDAADSGSVGPVRALSVKLHRDRLHAHEWVDLRFLAVESDQPLHSYEVRVATRPISDEASFIREGRPAKTATEDAEGAVSLMLPADTRAGEPIESAIGDLAQETEYWFGVRGKDVLNRTGPISVVRIRTEARIFATVSACFVATATYGTPLAGEVGSLRRFRDRFLMTHAPGRALVAQYYAVGPRLAAVIAGRPWLRRLARAGLSPLVALAHALE